MVLQLHLFFGLIFSSNIWFRDLLREFEEERPVARRLFPLVRHLFNRILKDRHAIPKALNFMTYKLLETNERLVPDMKGNET